jgi:hypothetical protein
MTAITEMLERLKEILECKPYSMDQFIADNDPKDHKDIQRLEEQWMQYHNRKFFSTNY